MGMKDQAKKNASGGAVAVAPIAAWVSQQYRVPVEVVAPVLVWAGVWLRGLVT